MRRLSHYATISLKKIKMAYVSIRSTESNYHLFSQKKIIRKLSKKLKRKGDEKKNWIINSKKDVYKTFQGKKSFKWVSALRSKRSIILIFDIFYAFYVIFINDSWYLFEHMFKRKFSIFFYLVGTKCIKIETFLIFI